MTQRQRARCKTPARPNQQTASRTQVRTMTHFWDVSHAWSPTPVKSASTGAAAGFSHSVRVREGARCGLRTGKESLVGREKVLIQRPVVDRDQNWAVRLVRDEEEDGVAPAQRSGALVRRRSPASPEPSASGRGGPTPSSATARRQWRTARAMRSPRATSCGDRRGFLSAPAGGASRASGARRRTARPPCQPSVACLRSSHFEQTGSRKQSCCTYRTETRGSC